MIRVEREGALVRIVLDRPDKANALTSDMLREVAEAVRGARDARALILTGEGRVFSAGADLDEVKTGLATDPAWEEASGAIAAFGGLSVAAVNGTLAGGAFGMAVACDIRIAVPGARFFYPVMRMGVLPQPSDPGRLVRLVGPARAALILMAAQKIEAEEALRFGLIDRIEEDVVEAARGLCAAALAAEPERIAAIGRMIRNA
ncbi:enoyl-CoA hydratase/isomerase family protein [Aestuariibius insulae]|uniref:enoyl-CoA hydratase/isomerase family protein n=1 Tax=Aestuariibius insulae TaxID=2058287 RepID=UPI00345E7E69